MDQIAEISKDFLSRLKMPGTKPASPFLVAMIGMVGSGRTTVAKMLNDMLPGSVLISANSARFLLSEKEMPWGQNVRDVLNNVARGVLEQGFGVIFDGNAGEKEDRDNISKIVEGTTTKVFYVRIKIDIEKAKEREEKKYRDATWVSGFDDFRVNTLEKMLANIEAQRNRDEKIDEEQIQQIIGVVDNNGSLNNLEKQVVSISDLIKQNV